MGAKTVAWAAATGASAIAGAASWVASMATMAASSIAAGAAMIVPFLPVIAIVAAVGVAGYLLYRNWDTVKGALIGAWNSISSTATSAFGAVEGAVKSAIGWLTGLPGKILDLETQSLKWLEDIGKNLITGMWNGISSMGDWLLHQLEGFAKKALGPFAKVFGIHSPSTVMAGYGLNLVQGLADGINRNAPAAQKAM